MTEDAMVDNPPTLLGRDECLSTLHETRLFPVARPPSEWKLSASPEAPYP